MGVTAATDRTFHRTFKKNSREVVKVSLETYMGRRVLNIRVWFDSDGEWKPSKKGLSLAVERLPELVEVLTDAMRAARPTWKPAA